MSAELYVVYHTYDMCMIFTKRLSPHPLYDGPSPHPLYDGLSSHLLYVADPLPTLYM